MQAVLMAGGFGTRIQPLTSTLPKPMLPILNRPMMGYVIEKLRIAGITDIIVLLYFNPQIIQKYFRDGSDFGVNIRYVLPDGDFGTAGALKKAQELITGPFMVVSGDLITDFSFRQIADHHRQYHNLVTIALTSVPNPLQFGVVITDETGRIIRFLEKPGWGEVFSDTINTGIYVLEPDVLEYIPADTNFDFSQDLFPKLMAENQPIHALQMSGYWRDVGNPESYRSALLEILDQKVRIPILGTPRVYPQGVLYAEEGCEIGDDITIEGMVVLGNNVTIQKGAHLSNCVLGNNVIISDETRIERSIIWDASIVGKKSFLNFAIICNNVLMGKQVQIEKGSIIAEGTEIGDNVIFDKDIMVWPNKQIEEGSIISSNLIWGDKWKKSIFEGGKVSGYTNVELSADLAAKLGSALGSVLSKNATITVARDYSRAARMIKRSFLGGVVAAGVNVIDLRLSSLPVMLGATPNSALGDSAGVYFRQSPRDPHKTEILFYDKYSCPFDSNTEKKLERIFYLEKFRRVSHAEIGYIREIQAAEKYGRRLLKHFDESPMNCENFRLVLDMMHSTTGQGFPAMLNTLGIDSVVLNAYQDERLLSRTISKNKQGVDEICRIVLAMNADMGCLISPHGERVDVVGNRGHLLRTDEFLLLLIKLIDLTTPTSVEVYVPTPTPMVLDSILERVKIVRGNMLHLSPQKMASYALVADLENQMVFPNYSLFPDALCTTLELIRMLCLLKTTIAEVVTSIPSYVATHKVISCPIEKKGLLMRKMSEEASGKEASYVDGVKIIFPEIGWVLMLPDQYSPSVHIYAEAKTLTDLHRISREYQDKINHWIEQEDE